MLEKDKKIKLIILLVYVLISCIFVYFVRPFYLFSIIVVLVPPTIANFIWLKKSRKKVFVFSLITTIFFAIAIELSSRLANSWDVESILPRLFGIAPVENILFAFLNFFWVLSFYEYFVDKDLTKEISKKFKYLVGLFLLFSLIIFGLYFYKSELVAINYFALAILILIIPATAIFVSNPKLLRKTILPMIFFAVVFFIYEIVSLLIGSWWWPGKYLFPANLFGMVFPIDDVIIWYFLSTVALIGGYEFFADDFK